MSVPVTTTAEVIADRYLASPANLRSRPFGPVDALDTHAGRAAQVRIVFLSGTWSAEEVSERVARWCGIGTAGVIGVLDFGEHEGRPFLVLPPSLGMPLERWRSMRRPGPVDAARLALGFGRLIEAVAAVGFETDLAEPGDFAIGPGPTPFLELPLLGRPDAPALLRPETHGQELIARLYRSTVFENALPAAITEWLEAAEEQRFETLARCLDALEAAAAVVHDASEKGEPLGASMVFDRPIGRRVSSGGTRNRVTQIIGVLALMVSTAGLMANTFHGHSAAPAARTSVAPVVPHKHRPVAPAPAPKPPATHVVRTAKHPRSQHPARTHHPKRTKTPVTHTEPAPPPVWTPAPTPSVPKVAKNPPLRLKVLSGGGGGSHVIILRHPTSP
jgi:hypothetical protein